MGLTGASSISAAAVFLQGILSFFSPCVLPLIPVYAVFLAGGRTGRPGADDPAGCAGGAAEERGASRRRLLVNTLLFVIGIGFSFFLLGLGMTSLGRFFASKRQLITRAGAVIIMLLGLYQLGVFGESELMSRERRLPVDVSKLAGSPLAALVAGFVFSFSWTPCVGPALSSVLLMAGSAESRGAGLALITLYTLGFCIPFMALGLFSDSAAAFFRRNRGFAARSAKIGGALMLAVGVLMFSGELGRLSGALAGSGSQPGETASVSEEAKAPGEGSGGGGPAEEGSGAQDASGADALGWREMSFRDQFGNEHRISDYEGKVVFLNFWGTWCPPCRAEMPDIQELYEELEADDKSEAAVVAVAFPGFSGEGSADEVAAFLEKNGYTYPVLMDTEAVLAQEFAISAFPTTFMIKKEGDVYGYAVGGLDKASMYNIIEQTLNASGSSGKRETD